MISPRGTARKPRIAFNKTDVLRYRIQLEAKHLAPATINLRLAAVRRLAYEPADVGLLSPDLAGIRRVRGAKRLGVRLGNWLSAGQAKDLLRSPSEESLIGKRDRAILALLLGCGLRRSEAAQLSWNIFRAGTITGPSSICSAKAAIFDPCPFRTGSRVSSLAGLTRLKSNPGPYFVA